MAGASKYNEKQAKELKKSSGNKSGKFEVDNFSQLSQMPGVKTVKRNR